MGKRRREIKSGTQHMLAPVPRLAVSEKCGGGGFVLVSAV